MSVELKVFGGAYFPKNKALKKSPELKPLVTAVKAGTKAIAEAVMFGKLAAEHPEHIEDYFKVNIWEHREGLPCPEFDVFTSDFFETVAVWNKSEPAAKQQPDTEENWQEDERAEVMKSVRLLDQHSRAACLALFGAVEEITAAQYGQVVDLINDDDGCFQRELAQAIVKEPRVLQLSTDRQEELLAWVRKTMLVSTQWPDIKKALTKWLDTPPAQREPATQPAETKTDSGATLGGGNQTDRSHGMVHNLATLRLETAIGILSVAMDFDIYAIPSEIMRRAKEMESKGTDPRFTAWWNKLRATPGILDYSRAAIIALIKTAPEDLYMRPVDLRAYINRELIESDHASPDQKTIAIACGTVKRETTNDETKPPVPVEAELPAVCPARAAQLDKELNEAFAQGADDKQNDQQLERNLAASRGEFVEGISDPADPKWVDGSAQPKIENLGGGVFSVDALIGGGTSNEGEKQEVPPALSEREVEIAIALNDLLAGRTRQLSANEAADSIAISELSVSDLVFSLMEDVVATECLLSPDLDDDEVQLIGAVILDEWSDDKFARQKVALDAIVEYRKPAPPKVQNPGSVNQELVQKPEAVNHAQISAPLNYHQQLTIAALQGLCSNPAFAHKFDELHLMAMELAESVIVEEKNCAD
ncbi:exodeoxyribonuclease VIII [Enterobacter asburiae]|uniref:exodeoxyribonuclease VIII n=1 Tax=Enterobacter asburiae TaxID=61645 RepID=UPI0010CA5853|nr:exodeoxyribonuclease VIII [Enterobacter asburiae]BBJ59180.1 exodeoxyribonuclease VIII [Enterobacter asburiae]